MPIDHAGSFLRHFWLVWVDAYFKFAGVNRVSNPDSTRTVNKLREVFAYFGLPNQIVSNNGLAFIADEFQQFIQTNNVHHICSAPYHPQTNIETKRFVQTSESQSSDQSEVTNPC